MSGLSDFYRRREARSNWWAETGLDEMREDERAGVLGLDTSWTPQTDLGRIRCL